MKLSEKINAVYSKNWSLIGNFDVEYHPGSIIEPLFKNLEITQADFSACVISINIPQMTATPIEVFTGNQWRYHVGHDELYTFSITFRDFNQMTMYRYFMDVWLIQKNYYFDEIATQIVIYKNRDYVKENDELLFSADNAIISSIGQVDFNQNTENQVAEFTVEFKCSEYTNYGKA